MPQVENEIIAPEQESTLTIFHRSGTLLGQSEPFTVTVRFTMRPENATPNVDSMAEIIDGPFTFADGGTEHKFDRLFHVSTGDEEELFEEMILKNTSGQNVESVGLAIKTWNPNDPDDVHTSTFDARD